jgi:ribonuclease G
LNRELIVNSVPQGSEIALLEDKKLVELHKEKLNKKFQVGDLVLGKVTKVVPGLNAAFVSVGFKKDAFLHYTDLGPNIRTLLKITRTAIHGSAINHLEKEIEFEKEIHKGGNISDVLKRKDLILVQILKEPISTKGPRLTCEITLPARNVVLTPFSKSIAASRKISQSKERKRLLRLVESIKPKGAGVIIRTAAEEKTATVLHRDIEKQMEIWRNVIADLKGARAPQKIFSEVNRTASILRDLMNESFNKIVTNDKASLDGIKEVVAEIDAKKEKIVTLHTKSTPVFDAYGVSKQLKASFGKTVSLPSGGYLVIEHTEALHVVDVNSGHKISSKDDQESGALKVNLEAAAEVARQLRLRDIGGIIIIDFIDMRSPANRKAVYNMMKDMMRHDRAKRTILPLSKFCLLQITRQRVREEVTIRTEEVCPSCNGTGKIEPSIMLVDDIEKKIDFIFNEKKVPTVRLFVHPYVEAFIRKGFPSLRIKWMFKYGSKLKLYSNTSYQLTEYRFYDSSEEEVVLK